MSDEFKKVSDEELVEKYQKHFYKNKVIAGTTGAIVSTLGKLLSALENPETPMHMKALIVGAIGYILLPFDLIPDFTPVIGYGDDLASAAGVVAAVAMYSDFSIEKLDAYIDQMEGKK